MMETLACISPTTSGSELRTRSDEREEMFARSIVQKTTYYAVINF
tara:strand:+ start:508 stop:642 length:135 start_codon:yes stop_codon:yes gene_type:complete